MLTANPSPAKFVSPTSPDIAMVETKRMTTEGSSLPTSTMALNTERRTQIQLDTGHRFFTNPAKA
jgi:hypothetical protein